MITILPAFFASRARGEKEGTSSSIIWRSLSPHSTYSRASQEWQKTSHYGPVETLLILSEGDRRPAVKGTSWTGSTKSCDTVALTALTAPVLMAAYQINIYDQNFMGYS